MDNAQQDGRCSWIQAMDEIKAIQKNASENDDTNKTISGR